MPTKLLMKGMLFYATALSTIILVAGIEALPFTSILLWLILLIAFTLVCFKVISIEDLEKITFCKFFGINLKKD